MLALMKERQIPGASLVVLKDGEIIKASHYGLANVEHGVPVNEDTSFMIGSMSKAFVPVALLLLVEEGKVGLDEPITDYLGDLPPSWRGITARRLLNHTAGIADDWGLHRNGDDDFFLTHTTNQAFLEALADVPLTFAPGDEYSYSGGAFVVGLLIEEVAGMPYAQFMQERIFGPLGMTRTKVNDAASVVPHRATGYRVEGGLVMRGVRLSPAAEARADVGILSTALDLAIWDAALSDTRLLDRSSLATMVQWARLNDGSSFPSGLGWSILPIRGHRAAERPGAFRTGFSSQMLRFEDLRLTVIVLTNLWNAFGNEMPAQEIAGFYNPDFGRISSMTPQPDPDPDRSDKLRGVLGPVSRGSHDPKQMTPAFPVNAYSSDWRHRHATLRSFSFVDCQNRTAAGNGPSEETITEVCFYRFSDAHGTGYLVYSLASDGRVVDLYTEQIAPHVAQ